MSCLGLRKFFERMWVAPDRPPHTSSGVDCSNEAPWGEVFRPSLLRLVRPRDPNRNPELSTELGQAFLLLQKNLQPLSVELSKPSPVARHSRVAFRPWFEMEPTPEGGDPRLERRGDHRGGLVVLVLVLLTNGDPPELVHPTIEEFEHAGNVDLPKLPKKAAAGRPDRRRQRYAGEAEPVDQGRNWSDDAAPKHPTHSSHVPPGERSRQFLWTSNERVENHASKLGPVQEEGPNRPRGGLCRFRPSSATPTHKA